MALKSLLNQRIRPGYTSAGFAGKRAMFFAAPVTAIKRTGSGAKYTAVSAAVIRSMTEIKAKVKKISIRQEDLDRYLHFCHERKLIIAGEKKGDIRFGLYPVRITHQGIAYIHDLR